MRAPSAVLFVSLVALGAGCAAQGNDPTPAGGPGGEPAAVEPEALPPPDDPEAVAAAVTDLLPAAAAIERAHVEPWAPPALAEADAHPLTLLVIGLPLGQQEAAGLRWDPEVTPEAIQAAILGEPCTILRAGNLMAVTCEAIEGDTARGVARVDVPGVVAGPFAWVARWRGEDGWEVTEFGLGAEGPRTSRAEDGSWRLAE